MALTPSEKQKRHYRRQQEKRKQLPKVECQCGCGELISALTASGNPATYKHGHNPGGEATRFQKGQEPWIKGRVGINSGPDNPNWNGGEWKLSHGYVRKTITRMEAPSHPTAFQHSAGGFSIQRSHYVWNTHNPDDPVMPGDQIHHLNHVRDDDRIENLLKLDGAEHQRHHRLEDPNPRDPSTGRFVPRM